MKKIKTAVATLLLTSSLSAVADTGVFIGFVYNFGENPSPGVSLKLVSSDEAEKTVGAVGFSYFPQSSKRIGADISIGRTYDNGLVTFGYDLFNQAPQFGLGYMDTK